MKHHRIISAGIDVGSLSADAVIFSDDIMSYAIVPTLSSSAIAAQSAFDQAIVSAGIAPEDIPSIVATGYGRGSVEFAHRTVTEITCHSIGARWLFPQARTVIDIGG